MLEELSGQHDDVWSVRIGEKNESARKQLLLNRDAAIDLLVELLRYQDWPAKQYADE